MEEKKLITLINAAKYDVSCSSSGSRRSNAADSETLVFRGYVILFRRTEDVYRF